jgi:hypothetical protein
MQRLEGCVSEGAMKLASSCVSYVLSNFERVCSAEAFLSLPFCCMEKIIADDSLNVSTEDVSGAHCYLLPPPLALSRVLDPL